MPLRRRPDGGPRTAAELAGIPWVTASEFEYIELLNTGTATLDLAGATLGNAVTFTFPPGTTLAPGATLLVVNDIPAFTARYGTSATIAGEFSGSLSNDSDTIHLFDSTGEVVLEFTYQDTWHPFSDGPGRSLVIKNPMSPYSDWEKARSWGLSTEPAGTPGVPDTGTATTYAAWRRESFTDAQAADNAISAPLIDMDSDGLDNLVEYAFTSDPRDPSGSPVQSGTILLSGKSYQTATYRRPHMPLDVSVQVETASSLTDWTPFTWELVSVTPNADGTETIVLRDPQPLEEGSRRYMRLTATLLF